MKIVILNSVSINVLTSIENFNTDMLKEKSRGIVPYCKQEIKAMPFYLNLSQKIFMSCTYDKKLYSLRQ